MHCRVTTAGACELGVATHRGNRLQLGICCGRRVGPQLELRQFCQHLINIGMCLRRSCSAPERARVPMRVSHRWVRLSSENVGQKTSASCKKKWDFLCGLPVHTQHITHTPVQAHQAHTRK
jgi:hypothetical protein